MEPKHAPIPLYLVGGTVRDHFLSQRDSGLKDIDFAVEAPSFSLMKHHLIDRGLRIWQERKEYATLRGQIPLIALGGGFKPYLPTAIPHNPRTFTINADFTLCRKDGVYSDHRHPDDIQPAPLIEDLSRRDFRCNAIAISESGDILDPFNGLEDIKWKLLSCVRDTEARLREDALRIVRAVRFAVTRDLIPDQELHIALNTPSLVTLLHSLPQERIRAELLKTFSHSTLKAMNTLYQYPLLLNRVFSKDIWLKPTSESH